MKRLCAIADLPRSTFYFRLQPKPREESDLVLRSRLQESQNTLNFTYGAKRMARHLLETYGEIYNHKRIANRMALWNLHAKIRRRRHPDSYYRKQKLEKASLPTNLLNRDFTAERPNQKLVTDVTFFRVDQGWLYLSAIQDLHNNEIIGYSFSRRLDMKFILATVDNVQNKVSWNGALFHSDRGWTYTNPSFTERLASLNLTQSLSRIGNPWDNAVIESFFGLLKSEIFYTVKLRLPADQLQGIIERYIEFYNKERILKKLGYLSPFQYRKLIA